jgi:hypothetical protein
VWRRKNGLTTLFPIGRNHARMGYKRKMETSKIKYGVPRIVSHSGKELTFEAEVPGFFKSFFDNR